VLRKNAVYQPPASKKAIRIGDDPPHQAARRNYKTALATSPLARRKSKATKRLYKLRDR
jgi:hypothetical protein